MVMVQTRRPVHVPHTCNRHGRDSRDTASNLFLAEGQADVPQALHLEA